jgi:hypothetical protein
MSTLVRERVMQATLYFYVHTLALVYCHPTEADVPKDTVVPCCVGH